MAIDAEDTFAISHDAPIDHGALSYSGDAFTWRRIALGPDAELLIREDAYHRKRDRVDWLIGWAKRVFH